MNQQTLVMPGLNPGINAVRAKGVEAKGAGLAGLPPAEAMAGASVHKASARVGGTSPAMTSLCVRQLISQLTLTRTSTEAVPASMGTSFAISMRVAAGAKRG